MKWKKGEHPSPKTEFKKGQISRNRGKFGSLSPMWGKKHSKDILIKMSLAQKGKKNHMFGKTTSGKQKETARKLWKENNPMFRKEIRNKVSKARIGMEFSEEHRRNIGKNNWMKGMTGEKCPFWQGGKSFESYPVDWTETLRRAIRERDHYICQRCYSYGNTVHHIDHNKKNCNPDNLITFCKSCHSRHHQFMGGNR